MSSDIRNIGSVLHTDEDGYIIKTASADKIQPKWRPAVDMIVEACKTNLGDVLHSVYVRGSVAKGEAIEGVSDVDMVVIVNVPLDSVDTKWAGNLTTGIENKYSFVSDVDFMFGSVSALGRGHKLILRTQAACLYGTDLSDELPPLKPGPDTIMHAKSLGTSMHEVTDFLAVERSEEAIRKKCTWIMKRIVRTGCELVMERSGKYARDLYPCYELFSQYYPEKQTEMYRALELAVNPSSDTEEIRKVLETLGEWMNTEIAKRNYSKF